MAGGHEQSPGPAMTTTMDPLLGTTYLDLVAKFDVTKGNIVVLLDGMRMEHVE